MMTRLNKQASKTVSKQKGVVLFFALIALVAMSLAAVALIRSVDTNSIIAGNLSFKQSTIFSADRGVEQAMEDWLLDLASDLTVDNVAKGYYASITDINGDGVIDNNADAKSLVDDNGFDDGADDEGNQISYVVQRLCKSGTVDANSDNCLMGPGTTLPAQANAGIACGAACISSKAPIYRVTAKVVGPKNTVSYIQAFLN